MALSDRPRSMIPAHTRVSVALVVAAVLATIAAGRLVSAGAQPAVQSPDTFEVASVKPMGGVPGEALAAFGSGCDGSFPRVENNRFIVTTTVYALLEGVVHRPLPYPAAERLVVVRHPVPGVKEGAEWGVSPEGRRGPLHT